MVNNFLFFVFVFSGDTTMEHEIACIDLSPLDEGGKNITSYGNQWEPCFLVVSVWNIK
jgi:hypothetical protein